MLMDDDEDESERVVESLDWGDHIQTDNLDLKQTPSAAYNRLSEALRQKFPHHKTCSMFCGGKKCKFCCPDHWKDEDQAIKGLYSHWVTDNILAMSRPITENMEKFSIIDQFKSAGITAVINTQLPGEHAHCGNGLHDNEFSYKQQAFMDAGIFFYNFGWKDFGVVEYMPTMLDMVKVMQFAISEGKVAIHCHAGKGRTGVLIGCFLVFHNRMTANEAIYYIRSKRPNSVQTGPQVKCIQDFELFVQPYRIVYSVNIEDANFNLTQFLSRQKAILHGYQARKLKFLPKIIYIICERLLRLANQKELLHIPSSTSLAAELTSVPSLKLHKSQGKSGASSSSSSTSSNSILNPKLPEHKHHVIKNGIHGEGVVTAEVKHVGESLINENLTEEQREKVASYEKRLNEDESAWDALRKETDSTVLSVLMWEWLDQLKDPVIRMQDMQILFENIEQPQKALLRLDKPIAEDLECDIIQKVVSVLTHRTVNVQPTSASTLDLRSSPNSLLEMNDTEKLKLFRYFYNLLEVIEDSMNANGLSK